MVNVVSLLITTCLKQCFQVCVPWSEVCTCTLHVALEWGKMVKNCHAVATIEVVVQLWRLDSCFDTLIACNCLSQTQKLNPPLFMLNHIFVLLWVVSCDYSYECSWFFVGCGWTWGEAYFLVWGLSHEHLPIWIQCVLRVCCDLLVCSYLVIALLLEICSWTLTCLETINLHYPANPPFVIGLPCNWPLVDWVNEN